MVGGTAVYPSRKEFDLARFLASRPGIVRPIGLILEHVYPEAYVEEHTVRSLVRNLRNRLRKAGADPVRTRQGFGYFWEV